MTIRFARVYARTVVCTPTEMPVSPVHGAHGSTTDNAHPSSPSGRSGSQGKRANGRPSPPQDTSISKQELYQTLLRSTAPVQGLRYRAPGFTSWARGAMLRGEPLLPDRYLPMLHCSVPQYSTLLFFPPRAGPARHHQTLPENLPTRAPPCPPAARTTQRKNPADDGQQGSRGGVKLGSLAGALGPSCLAMHAAMQGPLQRRDWNRLR